jgi:glycosyltransferase involved in cell wall biosynthesis
MDLVGEDTLGGAIASTARRLETTARVTFHGFLPTNALTPLYQRAHLFVLSSRHEAANVSVLEASAAGLPVVGSAVGYVADWSMDRAVAVEPGNPAALADAIQRTLADPQLRRNLAAAARAWTLAHDADWTARELVRVYSETRRGSRGSQGAQDSPR